MNLHAHPSPVNLLCFFSPFLCIYTPSISPSLSLWYGFHGNRGCGGKKKNTVSRVSELFFSSISLTLLLLLSISLSLSLPSSFTESQAVCGAINIINQHNSTALSSAGRGEEARGNVNMPAWSSLNQWYISHITWMRAGARKERQRATGERETDNWGMEVCFLGRGGRERASEQKKRERWRWRDRGVITWLSPTV